VRRNIVSLYTSFLCPFSAADSAETAAAALQQWQQLFGVVIAAAGTRV